MPKGKFVGNEGTVALRGVVRDGKLVGIIDHEEQERGIALVDVNKVTGGSVISVGDFKVKLGDASGNYRAITDGDSRSGQCFIDTYAANRTRSITTRGFWVWLQGVSGNLFQLVQAAGVGSDRISQVTSRFDSAIPGEMFGGPVETTGVQYGVSQFGADWIFQILGANDIADPAVTLSSLKIDATALLKKESTTGAKIVWINEPAVSAAQMAGKANYFDLIRGFNAWLVSQEAFYPNLCVVDAFPYSVNPADSAGACVTGMMYDGMLHPGPRLAKIIGDQIWAKLQARFGLRRAYSLPLAAADVYNVTTAPNVPNRFADPLLLATPATISGSGVSGQLPAGFPNPSATNATAVFSVVDHPSGFGKCIQADVDFTAAGGYAQINVPRIEALINGGDTVRFGAEFFVYGRSGATQQELAASHNLLTVKPYFRVTGGDALDYYSDTFHDSSNTEGVPVGSFNVEALTWPIVCPTGSPTRVQGTIFVTGAGAGSVRVLIGRIGFLANGGPQG